MAELGYIGEYSIFYQIFILNRLCDGWVTKIFRNHLSTILKQSLLLIELKNQRYTTFYAAITVFTKDYSAQYTKGEQKYN